MAFAVSVIIEWENVLLAEQERCVAMLTRLRQQILESGQAVEVLVGFNPGQAERAVVTTAVARYLSNPDDQGRSVACRVVDGRDLHYYQLKNLCARLASGELIVFLDSDVIPEPGWLVAIMATFAEHPDAMVVAGHTYLDPVDLLSRAFALGWFFPLRAQVPGLTRDARHFFANNVAFRHYIFSAHPFPDMPDGMTRGACVQLAATLRRENVAIWRQTAAQTSHPAPNGPVHFITRGLAQGRDWAMDRGREGRPGGGTGLLALAKVFSRSLRMVRRAFRHRRAVDLPLWQVPLAAAAMMLFYLADCLGAWAYLLAPGLARGWRRI